MLWPPSVECKCPADHMGELKSIKHCHRQSGLKGDRFQKERHPCSCIINKPAHLNEMTVETASWAFAALASPHFRWFSHSKHVFFFSATNRLMLCTMCKFYNLHSLSLESISMQLAYLTKAQKIIL